jgi:hypothetical protein
MMRYACLALVLVAMDAHAQERAAADRVLVPHGSGEYELRVHPEIMTVLYFPDDLDSVNASDPASFLIHASKDTLSIRPRAGLSAGTQASVRVVTRAMRVSLLVRVVEHGEHAALQRSFVEPDQPQPGQPQPGETSQPAPASHAARLSVQLGGAAGQAWVRDQAGNHPATPLWVGSLMARVGYQGGRFHAYEATIHIGRSELVPGEDVAVGMVYDAGVAVGPLMAETDRAISLIRAELGASARLPSRLTPVVRADAGIQRRGAHSRIRMPNGEEYKGTAHDSISEIYDLTGSVGLGVQYRAYRAWSVTLEIHSLLGWPLSGNREFTAWGAGFHADWQ